VDSLVWKICPPPPEVQKFCMAHDTKLGLDGRPPSQKGWLNGLICPFVDARMNRLATSSSVVVTPHAFGTWLKIRLGVLTYTRRLGFNDALSWWTKVVLIDDGRGKLRRYLLCL
jgi:hypothetical protein